MITADQIVCHLIGDYILQSDWQALNKTKSIWIAGFHGIIYGLPFFFLTQSINALTFIAVSHAIIDHYSLAKYLCWAKNWIGLETPKPFSECSLTGYAQDRPIFITFWLYVVADNTLHLILNGVALKFL